MIEEGIRSRAQQRLEKLTGKGSARSKGKVIPPGYVEERNFIHMALEETPILVEDLLDLLHRTHRLVELIQTGACGNEALMDELNQKGESSWHARAYPYGKEEEGATLMKALDLFQSSGTKKGDKIMIVTDAGAKDLTEDLIKICLENEVDFEIDFEDRARQTILSDSLTDGPEEDTPLKILTKIRQALYENIGIVIRT